MIINIISLAGHGKSYLTIKKALELAIDKRLNCMSWELDNPHMMNRIVACLQYHVMKSPNNIHLDQMDFSQNKNELEYMLKCKLDNYDVFILDGILMRPDAKDVMKFLEKISNEYSEKAFIVTSNASKPLNMSDMSEVHIDLRHKFFEIETEENKEYYMVVKQSSDFIVYDRKNQTSKVLNAEEFTFGLANVKSQTGNTAR